MHGASTAGSGYGGAVAVHGATWVEAGATFADNTADTDGSDVFED